MLTKVEKINDICITIQLIVNANQPLVAKCVRVSFKLCGRKERMQKKKRKTALCRSWDANEWQEKS